MIHIHVPPLRERRADIRPLIDYFLPRRPRPVHFTRKPRLLQRYRWPGNVRELQNVVEQAAWQSGATEIGPEHLPRHTRGGSLVHTRERRRQVADDLYEALAAGRTRSGRTSIRCSLRRHHQARYPRTGAARAAGDARQLPRTVALFKMQPQDYQRFHNFLTAHGCKVEFREFRNGDRPLALPRRVSDRSLERMAARGMAATRVSEDSLTSSFADHCLPAGMPMAGGVLCWQAEPARTDLLGAHGAWPRNRDG